MRKTKASKGKRYSEQERAKILAFVDKTNALKGRGGITAASKKFGVTPLSISSWMKRVGASSTARRHASGNFTDNLRRLAELHEAIAVKETELIHLRREYSTLKKKL